MAECFREDLGQPDGDGTAHVDYVPSGSDSAHLLAAGSQGRAGRLEQEGEWARLHDGPILAMTVSPRGDILATCGRDKRVKLWDAPEMELRATVAELALPARALAFSPNQEEIAFAGEDEGVVISSAETGQKLRKLEHSRRPVKCLTYDPLGEVLAMAEEDGTVRLCNANDIDSECTTLAALATPAAAEDPTPMGMAWRPGDGSLLAVPCKGRVAFISRDKREEEFAVRSEAGASKHGLARWSPNGLYLAVAGARQNLLSVHDMRPGARGREIHVIDTLFPITARSTAFLFLFMKKNVASILVVIGIVCYRAQGAAWSPVANTLALATSNGTIALWHGSIPESKCPAPYTPLEHLTRDDLYVEELSDDDDEGGEDEEAEGNAQEGGENAGSDQDEGAARKADGVGRLVYRGGGNRKAAALQNAVMQQVFQPGATSARADDTANARFLAYGLRGCVTSRKDETTETHVVETHFHDAGRVRVPAIASASEYTLGSLGDSGLALADAGTIRYRPFNPWSNDAEWEAALSEGEEPIALACGRTFVACVTSARLLRLFCEGGTQLHAFSLEGPPVCVCAHERMLCVAWHRGPPITDATAVKATQQVGFAVWDIEGMELVDAGNVPVTQGAHLSWLGFSETGRLACFDTAGVARTRLACMGGIWVPVFCSDDAKSSDAERHWMVGLTENEVVYVVCRASEGEPSARRRPVHYTRKMELPMLAVEGGNTSLESHYALERSALAEVQHRGGDASRWRSAVEQSLIRLFAEACKAGRQSRARALAARASLTKTIEGAWKLANRLKLTSLADEMRALFSSRTEEDEERGNEGDMAHGNNEEEKENGEARFKGTKRGVEAMEGSRKSPGSGGMLNDAHAGEQPVSKLQRREQASNGDVKKPKNPFIRSLKS